MRKFVFCETIIVNITAYRVIFFDIFLIREIKNAKSYYEAFHGNLVPRKRRIILYNKVVVILRLLGLQFQHSRLQYILWYMLIKLRTSENPSLVKAGCEGDAATGSVPISGSCSFEGEAPAGMLGILCRYP